MFDTWQDEPKNVELTDFDKIRIEDMDVNDKVDGECGYFSVHKYEKDYLVFVNAPKFSSSNEFKTYFEVFQYLEKL